MLLTASRMLNQVINDLSLGTEILARATTSYVKYRVP